MGINNLESVLLDALENISEAFVIYDKNDFLVTCNEKFRNLYDYNEIETQPGVHIDNLGKIALSRGNIVLGDKHPTTEEYLNQKMAYRSKPEGSFEVQFSNNRWIKMTDRRLSNGGFVSIQRDITKEKRNAHLLEEAKKIAEIANRAKTEFMANMSHELRTPLNAIIGFSSLIASEIYGQHLDPRYKEYANDVEGAGEHLLSLISEILDLAKIETGNIVLNERNTDIWKLSQSCKALVNSRALEKNVKVDIAVDPPTLAIHGDPVRLKQILVNLASNAVKFSKPKSKVFIKWTTVEDQIQLTVEDKGVGMEREFLPYLFEPFRRSRIATKMQCEGTGLGLTLVKKFCDAHDVQMQVSSHPGQGTTFSLKFPEYRTVARQQELAF